MEHTLKDAIEHALASLIGMPLWVAGQAGFQWFEFGPRHMVTDRHGRTREVGEYALHVQCAWRIVGSHRIIVASRDGYYPAGDPYKDLPNFEWNRPGANRCDEELSQFFEETRGISLDVESIEADDVGTLHIALNGGYTLDVFPDDSLDDEHWRLLQPAMDTKHFVVTGQGVENGSTG